MGDALCHLCQRPFETETMFVDRGGDQWCRSDDCYAVARERLANPKSPYRLRRAIARLEWQYASPVDPMELFNLASPAFSAWTGPRSLVPMGWCIPRSCWPSS